MTQNEIDISLRYENTIAAILTVAVLGGQVRGPQEVLKTWSDMVKRVRQHDLADPELS